MKYYFSFLCLFMLSAIFAQENPQWLRHSRISPDGTEIAFTYKGDIYKVPTSGGTAIQLTFHQAHDYEVVWSHDGSKLAFMSDRYGNFDVFVMSSNGGTATRLTYHSATERTICILTR